MGCCCKRNRLKTWARVAICVGIALILFCICPFRLICVLVGIMLIIFGICNRCR